MRKIWTITLGVLRQNRWLLLILILWPWLFTLLLMHAGGRPDMDDVLSLVHQEYFYGLALTAVLAANAFGAEMRSRRTITVLGRAVSRRQYLAALWLSGVLPGVLYITSMLGSGSLVIVPVGLDILSFLSQLAALLVLILWICSLALVLSLLLPSLMASLAVAVITALLLYLTGENVWLGLGTLWMGMMPAPSPHLQASSGPSLVSIGSVLVQACFLVLLANAIFWRKDISPVGE